jgi:hypothetical protein
MKEACWLWNVSSESLIEFNVATAGSHSSGAVTPVRICTFPWVLKSLIWIPKLLFALRILNLKSVWRHTEIHHEV